MTSALLKEVVFMLSIGIIFQWEEEFGDAKWIIKIRKSKKDRQHNGQKKKSKMTNNDLQNINLYRMFYFNLWIKRKYLIKCVPVKRLETQLIFYSIFGGKTTKDLQQYIHHLTKENLCFNNDYIIQ